MSTSNKNDTSNDNGVCEVNDNMLQNMKTTDINDSSDISNTCANCGKEGSDVTNTCNKCQSVMYCNAACKKKHRHKHKKDCEEYQRLAAERAAELHDEKLFKQPPQKEDCPICFLRIPSPCTGWRYKMCCGKVICSGCIYSVKIRDGGVGLCPFCRIPAPTSEEEATKSVKKRIEVEDARAIYDIGLHYYRGTNGFEQNLNKALELWHQAGELGFAEAYYNIGCAYDNGRSLEVDKKKAKHYLELAAMGGDTKARHNLGVMEAQAGNINRAIKHWMISARRGRSSSLNAIRMLFVKGHYVTKEDYSSALRAYQGYLNEVKSSQRDEAAAFCESYKYIE